MGVTEKVELVERESHFENLTEEETKNTCVFLKMAKELNYRAIFGKVDITSYLFSLIILFASFFAFFRSGSWMSLLSGLAFAILLSIGSYKTSLNRKDYHFTISKYRVFLTCFNFVNHLPLKSVCLVFDITVSFLILSDSGDNLKLKRLLVSFRRVHLSLPDDGLPVLANQQIHACRTDQFAFDLDDLLPDSKDQNLRDCK